MEGGWRPPADHTTGAVRRVAGGGYRSDAPPQNHGYAIRKPPRCNGGAWGTSRGLQGEVRAVEAEVRAVVRVAGRQERPPLQVEQVALALEAGLLLDRVLVTPRLRLQVVEFGVRSPHHAVAGLQH